MAAAREICPTCLALSREPGENRNKEHWIIPVL